MAKNTNKCKKKGLDKVKGKDACPVACGECEPACADSASWYYKKSKRDCEWVAENSDKRCKKKGLDKTKGKDACPIACDTCPTEEEDRRLRRQ